MWTMDTLIKRLNAVEIRINAIRLEIIALDDELNRMEAMGTAGAEETYLQMKLRFLAKKFELGKMKSERRLLELQVQGTRAAA